MQVQRQALGSASPLRPLPVMRRLEHVPETGERIELLVVAQLLQPATGSHPLLRREARSRLAPPAARHGVAPLDFKGLKFCRTIMPAGNVNNSG